MKRSGLNRLAAGMALALGLAACSSSGGAQEEEPTGGNAAVGGGVDTERLTFAMVTHEAPGDTFWDKIRAGAEDAAQALNVELLYSNNAEAPEQATLVRNVITQDVDGLAVTLAFADQVGPAAAAAAEADIPVVAFNSGIEQYKQYGAFAYFGSDERVAGTTAGEQIAAAGGEKAICVIQEQGSVALEARCEGVAAGFPNTEVLNVEGTDLPSVRSTIGAKLQQDPSVTHIVTLGAPIALTALDAVQDAGSDAEVITFDLNADVAQRIADGEIQFSIDQQPYVQGYMAITALWLQNTVGTDIGGGGPVLTGPAVVDADNIEPIRPFAEQNIR
jgi:simple sugar transport system substrate-binding protein